MNKQEIIEKFKKYKEILNIIENTDSKKASAELGIEANKILEELKSIEMTIPYTVVEKYEETGIVFLGEAAEDFADSEENDVETFLKNYSKLEDNVYNAPVFREVKFGPLQLPDGTNFEDNTKKR